MAARITNPKAIEAICPNSQRTIPHDHKGPTIWCPECGRKLQVKTKSRRYYDGYMMRWKQYPHHLDSQRGFMF